LQSGSVENQKFLVYDAHVPYKLQFFIENNLYGMGRIQFKNMLFRYPLPSNQASKDEMSPKGIFKETTNEKFILPPKVLKISSSPLEIDINADGKN
jgi:DNA polymerase zeta